MATRRHGNLTAFWNAAAVSATNTSTAVEVGRHVEDFAIYITTSAAATFYVQVGHSGSDGSEGTGVDTTPAVWHAIAYASASPLVLTTAAAPLLSIAMIIPDFSPGWVRLYCISPAGPTTVTAGFEATSSG